MFPRDPAPVIPIHELYFVKAHRLRRAREAAKKRRQFKQAFYLGAEAWRVERTAIRIRQQVSA